MRKEEKNAARQRKAGRQAEPVRRVAEIPDGGCRRVPNPQRQIGRGKNWPNNALVATSLSRRATAPTLAEKDGGGRRGRGNGNAAVGCEPARMIHRHPRYHRRSGPSRESEMTRATGRNGNGLPAAAPEKTGERGSQQGGGGRRAEAARATPPPCTRLRIR